MRRICESVKDLPVMTFGAVQEGGYEMGAVKIFLFEIKSMVDRSV